MDPEQWLFVIHEHLAVKVNIVFLCTLTWILCPKRVCITDRYRTSYDLRFLLRLSFFAFLWFLCDMLYNSICVKNIILVDCVILRLCICLGEEDLYRHERTISLKHFSCTVLVCKFKTILIQEQCDLTSNCCLISFLHLILCTALTCPVYRLCAFFIRKSINLNFVCYHECRIESKSEVSNHLIVCCLVFIFLKELCCTGKCDLSNILLNFLSCHTKSVIDKLHCFLFWIDNYFNLRFIIFREFIFSHHVQLFQLSDRITSVGYEFTYKDIMIGINPFLDNRKNVFAVN